MRTVILVLLFAISLSLCAAQSTDEVISQLVNGATFRELSGCTFLGHESCRTDNYLSESSVYEFLAVSAYICLVVQQNWIEYTDTSAARKLKGVDLIECPMDDEYLAIVSMSSIRGLISKSDFESMSEDECIDVIYEYAVEHALDE